MYVVQMVYYGTVLPEMSTSWEIIRKYIELSIFCIG